jgi:predicted RNase H-like HicB family nuclease
VEEHKMQKRAQFSMKLPIKVTKREKWVLASCPILDVHSQGENEKQARKNLVESLSLFLISCFERGTLEAVLKECGFRPLHPSARYQDKPIGGREDYINVPLPFLVNHNAEKECRA